ncbi:conserved protein of unknown function [Burkholderia multivorans]
MTEIRRESHSAASRARAKPALRSLRACPRVPALDPVETSVTPHQIADDVADAFAQGVAHYLTHPVGVLARHSCADGLPQYAAHVPGIAYPSRAAEPWPGPACCRAHRAAPFPFFRRSVRS